MEIEYISAEWISTKDKRKPEHGQKVIVTDCFYVCEGIYHHWDNGDSWGVPRWFNLITYWMAMPRPPKENK